MGQQVENPDVVPVIGVQLRNEIYDLGINVQFAPQNAAQSESRGRANFGKGGYVEEGIFCRVQRNDVPRTVGQHKACHGLAKDALGSALLQECLDGGLVKQNRFLLML